MKKFKITTITLASIGLLLIIFSAIITSLKTKGVPARSNTQCKTTERVFDEADVLTDEEEEKLRKLISETEPQIGCDIVLVTIDDSSLASDYAMMNYADDFYDEAMFGWDEPWGDGALYLDNWGRDEYGDAYSWFSTCGEVEYRYSTNMINNLIDDVCAKVNNDPYKAYETYIETLKRDMLTDMSIHLPWILAPIAGLIAAFIFIGVNMPTKAGQVTTSKQTYVRNEDVKLLNREDTFLSKNVTHVKISTSSGGSSGGGGGGGHHTSSGGHSHGGGGGRH